MVPTATPLAGVCSFGSHVVCRGCDSPAKSYSRDPLKVNAIPVSRLLGSRARSCSLIASLCGYNVSRFTRYNRLITPRFQF